MPMIFIKLALITAVAVAAFLWLVHRLARRVERAGRLLGMTYRRGPVSDSAPQSRVERLEGTLLGVPIVYADGESLGGARGGGISIAATCNPGSLRGVMLHRQRTLPKGSKARPTGTRRLDKVVRWLPEPGAPAEIPKPVCAALARMFRPASFRLEHDVIDSAVFDEHGVTVQFQRVANIGRCIAQTVAVARALHGDPIAGNPLAALRRARKQAAGTTAAAQ